LKVLLTNDDGYNSPLYLKLADYLIAEDWIEELCLVAPAYEQSWIGTAVSTHHSVEVSEKRFDEKQIWTVKGTPSDCTTIGSFNIMNEPPDLIISGINFGSNAGTAFATNSGTLAGARQAAYLGLNGIACSAVIEPELREAWRQKDFDFLNQASSTINHIAKTHVELIRKCLKQDFFNKNPLVADYISINTPMCIENTKTFITQFKDTKYIPFFEKQDDGKFKHSFKGFKNIVKFENSHHKEESKDEVLPFDIDVLNQGFSSVTLLRSSYGVCDLGAEIQRVF